MTKKGGDPAYVGFTWRRWTGFASVQMNQNTEHLALDQSLILSFPCIYVHTFPSANKECLNNVWTRQGNSGATLERGSQSEETYFPETSSIRNTSDGALGIHLFFL